MKYYLEFILSMLIFGTIGIFRKFIPLSSGMLAFTRGVMGSLFLLLIVAVRHKKLQRIGRKKLWLLALSGALMGLNWIALFEAYNYTSVATATLCYYMQPTIVILLSPAIFKEKLGARRLICALAAIVGMAFVSGLTDGAGVTARDLTGILLGLLAAALYAAVVIMNKKLPTDDAYGKTILQLICAAVALVPYLLATGGFSLSGLDATAIVMVLVVGLVHTGLAYALYFSGMQRMRAQSVAVLGYIDPVFALLLSAAVLREKLTLPGVIGSVLIVGSALISELNFSKKEVA